ncbi:hypothetical protein HC928_08145 [bacterium]|nr:hypothetical protein [bacterium]
MKSLWRSRPQLSHRDLPERGAHPGVSVAVGRYDLRELDGCRHGEIGGGDRGAADLRVVIGQLGTKVIRFLAAIVEDVQLPF